MNPLLLRRITGPRTSRTKVRGPEMGVLTEVACYADFKYGVLILDGDETLAARMVERWGMTERTWKKKIRGLVDGGLLRIDPAGDERHTEYPPERTYVRIAPDELLERTRDGWEEWVDRARFAVISGKVEDFTRAVDDERRRLVSRLGEDAADEPLIREQLAQLDDLDGAVGLADPSFYLGVEAPAPDYSD